MKEFYKKYFKTHEVLFFSLMSMISVLLAYSIPQINRIIIDNIAMQEDSPINLIVIIIIVTVLLFFIHLYIMYFPNFFGSIQQCKIEKRIRHDLVKKYLTLPYYEYAKFDKSFLLNIFLSDVGNASSVLINFKVAKIVSTMQFVIFFIIVLFTDFKLALISLVFIPLYFFALMMSGKNLYILSNSQNEKYDRYVSIINSIIGGKKQINLNYSDSYFKDKQNESMNTYFEARLKREFVLSILNRLPVFIQALCPLTILIIGAKFVQQEQISIGTLIMFVQYVGMMFEPIGNFVQLLTQKNANIPAFERLSKVLFNTTTVRTLKSPEDENTTINIKNTNICTEEKKLFYIDNLEIKKTGLYLIKGENGAGKTTFLNLLSSLYKPELFQKQSENSVVEISNDFSTCSYLSHPHFMFDGTVLENILMGKPENNANLSNLCQLFNFNEFLNKPVLTNPINLSDGEQQKIALIRTLLLNRKILILDEPEKSLDAESVKKLHEYILNLKDTHLIIIISHFNTFNEDADAILQIQNSELIVEYL